MKLFHNTLMLIQWSVMVGGILGSIPLAIYQSYEVGLLALVAGMIALMALKLEAIAFLPPGRTK